MSQFIHDHFFQSWTSHVKTITRYVSLKNRDPIIVTAFDILYQKASLGYTIEQIEVNVHDMKFHKL